MTNKFCNTCRLELSLDNFTKDKSTKDNLKNTCKKCCSIKNVEWRKNNKQKRSQYQKEYKIKNKEYLKE